MYEQFSQLSFLTVRTPIVSSPSRLFEETVFLIIILATLKTSSQYWSEYNNCPQRYIYLCATYMADTLAGDAATRRSVVGGGQVGGRLHGHHLQRDAQS